MEHLENTEQLCKSPLQCSIFTNCISLDGTQQALHAGTHIVGTWMLVVELQLYMSFQPSIFWANSLQ